MKRRIFNLLLDSLFFQKAIDLFRFLNRKRIIILMVHDVIDESNKQKWDPLRKYLKVDIFKKVIDVLLEKYSIVSLQDAIKMIEGEKELKNNSVVLTFDDGYYNNFKYAKPYLEKNNIPATIFIATNNITNRVPYWFNRLDYAIQNNLSNELNIDLRYGIKATFYKGNIIHNRLEIKKLLKDIKDNYDDDVLMHKDLNLLFNRIEQNANKTIKDIFERDDYSKLLSWRDICSDRSNLIDIGSHTLDHYRLTKISFEEKYYQIIKSKKEIENRTKKQCLAICYPNGNFDESVKKISMKSNYIAGISTKIGYNSVGQDLYELKRIAIPNISDKNRILYQLSGLPLLFMRVKSLLFNSRF